MAHHHLDSAPAAQMFGQALGQVNRAMLAAGAAKRYHQALETAAMIIAYAGVDQRHCAGEELMHALLLVEILDHRGVFAGEVLEALFASWIGNTAGIENESAAMSAVVFPESLVKGKAEKPHHQMVPF